MAQLLLHPHLIAASSEATPWSPVSLESWQLGFLGWGVPGSFFLHPLPLEPLIFCQLPLADLTAGSPSVFITNCLIASYPNNFTNIEPHASLGVLCSESLQTSPGIA